jgi:hypothetical protein
VSARRPLILAWLGLCAAGSTLSAQSLWPRKLDGTADFGLEWVRPSFEGGDGYATQMGVWILDARVRVGQRLNIAAAFPRINTSTDAGSASTAGSVYLGVEFTDTAGRPEFSLGFRKGRAALGASGAFDVGGIGDFDRIEQTLSRGYAITAVGHTRPWNSPDGAFAELRFGASAIFDPSSEGEGGTGMFLDYGIRMGKDGSKFGAGFAWTGRWAISNYGASPANTIDQLTLDVAMTSGLVRPSVAVRIPFDENLKESLDYALIFGVRVALK